MMGKTHNCPFLEARGIKHNDNSTQGHEICEHCPLEKCIYDIDLRGKSQKQFLQEQLKGAVFKIDGD